MCSLSAACRGAVKVLLCEAFIVRPKDVVLAFAIWCVSRNRKCFASRGIDRSFKRCSFGFCYLVRFRDHKCFASRGIVRSSERCSLGFCCLVRSAGP